jgi:hypothetical protein
MHDDDFITDSFKPNIESIVSVLSQKNVGHIVWDAIRYDLRNDVPEKYFAAKFWDTECTTYTEGEISYLDPARVASIYADPTRCTYPSSPVIHMTQTSVLHKTLKECEQYFIDKPFFTRPYMTIGNDILLVLRNMMACSKDGKSIAYIPKPFTYYGWWDESESERALLENDTRLVEGYCATREYFRIHPEQRNVGEEECIQKRMGGDMKDFFMDICGPTVPLERECSPIFLHCVNVYGDKDKETIRREQVAIRSWVYLYNNALFIPCPLYIPDFDRTSKSVGDELSIPFIRDLLSFGCEFLEDDDILIFTNSDVGITCDAHVYISERIRKYNCGFSFRWDAHFPLHKPIRFSEQVLYLRAYIGSDLFAFTKQWWMTKALPVFPDLILGKPNWDWVMRFIMEWKGAGTSPSSIVHEPLACIGRNVVFPPIIFHERHESYAECVERYTSDRANIYVWAAAFLFFEQHYTFETINTLQYSFFRGFYESMVAQLWRHGISLDTLWKRAYIAQHIRVPGRIVQPVEYALVHPSISRFRSLFYIAQHAAQWDGIASTADLDVLCNELYEERLMSPTSPRPQHAMCSAFGKGDLGCFVLQSMFTRSECKSTQSGQPLIHVGTQEHTFDFIPTNTSQGIIQGHFITSNGLYLHSHAHIREGSQKDRYEVTLFGDLDRGSIWNIIPYSMASLQETNLENDRFLLQNEYLHGYLGIEHASNNEDLVVVYRWEEEICDEMICMFLDNEKHL